jgi:membrane protein YqaA with SNARE-associated domain
MLKNMAGKENIMKRTYNWVLGWADSKWGGIALFILAFAESSFFPIPPDILLIALCLGCPRRSFRYALICTTGSVLGAMGGYALGFYLWQGVHDWFIPSIFSQESFNSVAITYEKWNFWAVFTAGFTPIPYKIFTIAAGVCNINLIMFILASMISRGLRFFLIGWLIWKFGAPIKIFIDKYFNLLAIAFTVLLIGSFLLIKYIV